MTIISLRRIFQTPGSNSMPNKANKIDVIPASKLQIQVSFENSTMKIMARRGQSLVSREFIISQDFSNPKEIYFYRSRILD